LPVQIGRRRTAIRWLAGTLFVSLIGVAVTSPLFAMFIVEESIQIAGFGIFMSSSYKDYNSMQEALKHYKNVLDRGSAIAKLPIPVISLVQAYFLYLDAAYGYWRISSQALEYKNTHPDVTTQYTRVCTNYEYEYKIENIKTSIRADVIQKMIDDYTTKGWYIKDIYTTVIGKTYYQTYVFTKITVTETTVPAGTICPP